MTKNEKDKLDKLVALSKAEVLYFQDQKYMEDQLILGTMDLQELKLKTILRRCGGKSLFKRAL